MRDNKHFMQKLQRTDRSRKLPRLLSLQGNPLSTSTKMRHQVIDIGSLKARCKLRMRPATVSLCG